MTGKEYVEKVRYVMAPRPYNGKLVDVFYTILSKKLNETTLEFKVAYCSPKDRFVKKEGIRVARESDKVYTVEIPENASYADINFEIWVHLMRNSQDAPRVHREHLEMMKSVVANI